MLNYSPKAEGRPGDTKINEGFKRWIVAVVMPDGFWSMAFPDMHKPTFEQAEQAALWLSTSNNANYLGSFPA